MMNASEMNNQQAQTRDTRPDNLSVTETTQNISKIKGATLTLIESKNPDTLTKNISLSKEGRLIKQPSAQLYEGFAILKEIGSIEEFSDLVLGLTPNQALVYGTPIDGIESAKIVTKSHFESLSSKTGFITRSKDHFDWPNGAGIMMLDYDPVNDVELTKDELLDILYEVCPEVKAVDHLWWISSSSNIVNTETGEQLTGISGQRIYFIVNDANDIPRTAKVIEQKLWLAGNGSYKISASGAMLERVPFDMTVYQPSRLDFAAGANCKSPLQQQRGEPEIIKGNSSSLDTKSLINELGEPDTAAIKEKMISIKAIAGPKAKVVKEQFVKKMTSKLRITNKFLDEDTCHGIINNVLDNQALPSDWIITVWNGEDFIETTVKDILDNKYDYQEMLCLDPIEPDYDGGRLVGKLYSNQAKPVIHSFARGGKTYRLFRQRETIVLHASLSSAVDQTLEVVGKGQDVFNYGGTLVYPNNGRLIAYGKDTMKYYLSGLVQYFGAKNTCDPSNDLVNSVLAIGSTKNIKLVKGIVDHPVITPALNFIAKGGYDGQSKYLAEFNIRDFVVTNKTLNTQEVRSHIEILRAPFRGFELAGKEDESVLFAAIMSSVLRQVLPTCPAFGIDAPVQGSGKTLLAEALAAIASKETASATPPSSSMGDDEFRKRLMALLLKGEKVSILDNIVGEFNSPSFAAALTSEYYEDRILGYSKTGRVLNKTMFILTGNNLNISGDMNRRVIRLRLQPNTERLTDRQYDFDPVTRAKAMRNHIVSSVLSLVNHWIQSGTPKAKGQMSSFGEWDDLIRQPLALISTQLPEYGLIDLVEITNQQQSDSTDKEALIQLLSCLASSFGVSRRFKSQAIWQAIGEDRWLGDAILGLASDGKKTNSSQAVGNLLKQYVDRTVDGLMLKSAKVSGSFSYWVEATDEANQAYIQNYSRPHSNGTYLRS